MMKFLLEIGVEEFPARFIVPAVEQLAQLLCDKLKAARIEYAGLETFCTPRRLAVRINEIAEKQQDLALEVKGPPKNIAYQNGQPTQALLGFTRTQGVDVNSVVVKSVGNAEYVFAQKFLVGQPTLNVLSEILPEVVTGLSFPKNMRWGNFELRYARPLRWLVALLDTQVVPFSVENVKSGNISYGHRQLSQGPVEITHPDRYLTALEEAYVIADHQQRKALIGKQITQLAAQYHGVVHEDDSLLEEVTNLVEYPTAFVGSFSKDYLSVPAEVLIMTMKEHQRYFPVHDHNGDLLPLFIGVRNGADNQLELVVAGNEKVLKARLADAEFFFKEDCKLPLEQYTPRLKQVVFQDGLGSVHDKIERISQSAKNLCQLLHKEEAEDIVLRTAYLAKADLVTSMVYEFPELQGIIGSKYALICGEKPEVAAGIEEHYHPRFSGDSLPQTTTGIIVGLADKLDTLVGYFGLGKVPTGSQDPFALRRHALGVVQILLANNITVDLPQLISVALQAYGDLFADKKEQIAKALLDFFAGRVRVLMLDQGYRYDSIDAVLATGLTNLPGVKARIAALDQFRESTGFIAMHTAFTRCAKLAGKIGSQDIDPSKFTASEQKLDLAISQVASEFHEKYAQAQYLECLEVLSKLRHAVDEFFDAVMIMDQDPQIRANRLGLLQKVINIFTQYGDFSLIVTEP